MADPHEVVPWPQGVPKPLSAPPLTRGLFTGETSDGPAAIRFIESNLVLGEGDRFGEPVKLETFQKVLLCLLLAKKPNGQRRYRRVLWELPKGNSKTGIAAWVGLYLLATQRSPVIPVSACTLDQANITFGDMKAAVTESPTLRNLFNVFENDIQVKGGPGRAFKVPASGGSNDGLRPSAVICDEIHEFLSYEQERTHVVLQNGCRKRSDSLFMNITTPGHSLDSLAGRLHEHGEKVNTGEVKDDSFLFVHFGCPVDRYDLNTAKGLLQAVRDANPAADLFLNADDVASGYSQMDPNDFCRYHLGIWPSGAGAWLPHGAWDACAAPGVVIPDGAEVCLGLDGSTRMTPPR